MSMINVSGLTFGYEGSGENLFENVSFRLDTDWRLGFTGRNGRGKTTFLKLLLGEYEYTGSITSSVGFEYFPYAVGDENEDILALAYRLGGDFEQWELERELSLLGLGDDILFRSYSTLSMGERTKVLLALMFLGSERFMLIDEPTNHLDMEARELVARYLASKRGFILVSHDRSFLDACTDHTLAINRADITVTAGSFSVWYHNKQLRDNFEAAEDEKLRREISRLNESARRTASWSDTAERGKIGFDPRKVEKNMNRRAYEGAKSKKLMSRAKAAEKRIEAQLEEKQSLLKNIEETEELHLNPLSCPVNRLAELSHVSVWRGMPGSEQLSGQKQVFGPEQMPKSEQMPESEQMPKLEQMPWSEQMPKLEQITEMEQIPAQGRLILTDVSFKVEVGDRICLAGANGCGKSTLIQLLLGDGRPYEEASKIANTQAKITSMREGIYYTGDLYRASGLVISYLPQDVSSLSGTLTEFESQNGVDRVLFRAILRKLDFPRSLFDADLSTYSAGQKKKVALARSLAERAQLYIWDEPLNYIDIYSRMQIEALLSETDATVIFVEHDRAFRDAVATKVIEL